MCVCVDHTVSCLHIPARVSNRNINCCVLIWIRQQNEFSEDS